MCKVIVIGAGAAGMMAACRAAECGAQVLLLEKNEKAGKKLFITGKGRCNLTNACDMENLFENVVHNAKFLYSAFYGFSNFSVMDFFEENGCRLKTERGSRVFPASDHSSDVIRTMERLLKERRVTVRFHTEVTDILTRDKKIMGVMLKNGTEENADAVIVASGGLSYPSTGSTGDGYRMAEKSGHTIINPAPSLVPFEIKGDNPIKLQGLSLKNVRVSLVCGQNVVYEGMGEMLFTHFGVSGPLILSASSYYSEKEKNSKCFLNLDLKPALTAEQLDKRILRDFAENQNKQFKNAIGGLFPARLIPVMIELSGIDPDKTVNKITKEERKNFVSAIKGWKLEITGTRDYAEAIVTRGGVHVKEVNPATMESRRIKGLYFAGEVLDVDALTGGFNLQIAWSTGYLAGENAAFMCRDPMKPGRKHESADLREKHTCMPDEQ